jgi:murein DD-endopeptidase MepM/ murein hydrolase activator NlpD
MKDPFTGDLKDHKGIDFSAKRGTPVIATASGVVDLVENHKYWGNRIRIKHRYGFSSVYAHLGTVNVRMDQKVKKGDEIGTIGLSGLTIGPHLHYEIRRHGTLIDPENYFFPEDISQLTAE